MKKTKTMITVLVITGILYPGFSKAQGLANDIQGMQSVLDRVYNDMIPLCSRLIGVGRGNSRVCGYVVYRIKGLAADRKC